MQSFLVGVVLSLQTGLSLATLQERANSPGTIFVFENRSYLGEFEAEFKKALARESGA
jgi:hypothetical protein